MNQRTCVTCGTAFQPHHSRNIYCGPECRADEHPKITVPCDSCGTPCEKERSQIRKYKGVYCSYLCRDYARTGGATCAIPTTHWSKWYGATSTWSPPVVRNTGNCSWCGAPNQRNRSAAYCSETCKERAKRQRRRAAEFNAPGEYTHAQLMRQYRRQGYTCAYCGTRPKGLPDPEHVIPLSKGGRNDMTNIVAACRPCNSDKRDLLLTEWNTDRQRRGLPAVSIDLTGRAFLRLAA